MALGAYQKISRVFGGQPFGTGVDGAYSSATIPTMTKDSCSGSATSTTLTTSASTFANGDLLLIHQTRGTGAGQWEINRVSSGGGSTSLTLQVALNYTYTDSGVSQAQAVKIPQYTDVTVQAGTWTVPTWDANVSGILTFAAKGIITVTGTISASEKGFRNINGVRDQWSNQGEGTSGEGTNSLDANGNGGGGGLQAIEGGNGGGGGGNGATGTAGGTQSANPGPGTGGTTAGSADLTTIVFGGGGGRGGASGVNDGMVAQDGGGIILIFCDRIVITGGVTTNGENGSSGGSGNEGGAGGGAGGSILIETRIATLGTNLITASGGSGDTAPGTGKNGGAGGVGRIAVHHSGTITGTTSPTFSDTTDATLVETLGGSFIFNMV